VPAATVGIETWRISPGDHLSAMLLFYSASEVKLPRVQKLRALLNVERLL
jgi:hypothetical protein